MRDVFAPNGGIFLDLLVDYVSEQGHDLPAALDASGITLKPTAEPFSALPVHEHAAVFDAAQRLCGDPSIGISLACHACLRSAGLVGYAIGASATIGEALRTLTRLSDIFRMAPSDRHANQVDLSWDYGAPGQLNLRHWTEFTLALLVRSLRKLADGAVTPVSVEVTHARRHGSQAAAEALGVVVHYNGAVNRISYNVQDLEVPIEGGDPGLLDLLMEHARLLQRIDVQGENATAVAVERLILDGIGQGTASLAMVSQHLGVSQRTLSRKLTAEGTSFFAILEGVRKSLALRYLQQNQKSISEISFLLGYASLSSFNDAFRRWTGQSPGSYRSSHRHPE